ncbi:MAG: SUMF1/EgtB/PvdO family nonheme iron enzyme [Rhodomicrobium sp.]
MLRAAARIFVGLMMLAFAGNATMAGKRVALVIGNSAYTKAPALANPKNDAQDMAAALKALGFTVIFGTDLDKRAMDRKILEFAGALSGAEAGVFHYSGHGLQVAGVNYLVPVDAELASAAALDFEAVPLNLVQRTMERETKTNILFLDACRNNPLTRNLARALGTRSTEIGRGLAPVESGAGTLISFSTQPGNVALDGTGRNSPYSGPLVKAIGTPGEDVLSMLTGVRNAVMAATAEKQVPWDNNALRAKFYFNRAPAPASPAAPLSADAQAWSLVQNSGSEAVLEEFARRFPGSVYAGFAKARLEELRRSNTGSSSKPQPAGPPETQTALVAPQTPPKPVEAVCKDGLLVAVAAGKKPCIKPGSGESFRDCPDCPEMVIVPAGGFTMGSPESEPGRTAHEGPLHRVTFSKPFAVGRFAVTFAEWDACIADGSCGSYVPGDEGWGRDDRPVIDVSWNDAKDYVQWLSKNTGKEYRLLSEAEREYAARAGSAKPFWWGSSISTAQANYNGNAAYNGGEKGGYRQKTLPVSSFKPNPWGLDQVHGNVAEWVEDCWNESYLNAPSNGSAWTSGDCGRRVLRGGSWYDQPLFLRSAYRIGYSADRRFDDTGFRVARTLND